MPPELPLSRTYFMVPNMFEPLNFYCSCDVCSKIFIRADCLQRHKLQSTLVISKSKGPSKTVRDIRTSTYQICSIEEKTI